MFINKKFLLKSGDGGNGNISYYIINNKFYANGGNGGDGGDVYLFSNNNFKIPNNFFYFSKNGKNGLKNKKNGKKGKDLVLKFPVGIYIKIQNKNIYIIKNNNFIKMLKGGKGGYGNNIYKNFFNSKIANFGKKGLSVIINIFFLFFFKKCFINVNNCFFKVNNFNYKNNFISKIYIFVVNVLYFKIIFKIIKFFLYFLYLKNLKKNIFWVIIDGIENIPNFNKLKKINLMLNPFFCISSIFYLGIKKFFHFIRLWKNS